MVVVPDLAWMVVVLGVPAVEAGMAVGQEVHTEELLEPVEGVLGLEVVGVQVEQIILHHSSHRKQTQLHFDDRMNRNTYHLRRMLLQWVVLVQELPE
jgi:hypothetical protein